MGVGRSVAPVRQYTRWPLVSVSVLAMGCGRRALMLRPRVWGLLCSELDELATAHATRPHPSYLSILLVAGCVHCTSSRNRTKGVARQLSARGGLASPPRLPLGQAARPYSLHSPSSPSSTTAARRRCSAEAIASPIAPPPSLAPCAFSGVPPADLRQAPRRSPCACGRTEVWRGEPRSSSSPRASLGPVVSADLGGSPADLGGSSAGLAAPCAAGSPR